MTLNEYLSALIALFAIVSPIGSMPLFLAFTENMKKQRPIVARVTGVSVAAILIIAVFGGQAILSFFDVSLDAFRIAGGILILFMALEMLRARRGRERHTPEEDKEAIEGHSVGITPLAMPLLAGPGAITTVILMAGDHPGFDAKIGLAVCCLIMGAITWGLFRLAPIVEQNISTTTINIVMRIMGLLLAAIAVEFITDGLRNLLPGLA